MSDGRVTICQISDIHCGNSRFIPELLDRTIIEINRLNPTAVVVAGDLTDAGYREEFEQTAEDLDCIEWEHGDWKSTSLNSRHANISYAVFCLKKKIKTYH